MRILSLHKKLLLHSQSLRYSRVLLLFPTFLLLLLLFPTFRLLRSPPPASYRRIQPPNLSHCHPIYLSSASSAPLNCCAPSLSTLQIVDFTFPLPSSPLRTRPAAHLVDAHYISQYSKAVQLMKGLPNTDPRSFFQQAGVHCAYCNGAYDQQMMENGATTELFLGTAFRAGEQPAPGPGSLEFIPHNTVHEWTGDPRKNNNEDMGAFYSAARDPLFYAHHANIDRLWSVWKTLSRKHKDFSDSDWLDSAFLFYDEEARLVRVKVRDCVDMDRLRYRYQEVDNPWINSRRRSHSTMKKWNGLRDNYEEEVKFPVKVEKEAVVAKVKRPRRGGEGEVEVLMVEGIESDGTESARFDVYVNASSDELRRPAARGCVGSFVSLPRLGREGKGRTNLKLGISELIEEMGAEGDDTVTVTLVPRKGKATVAGLHIGWLS